MSETASVSIWPASLERLTPPPVPDDPDAEHAGAVRLWLRDLLTTSCPSFGSRSSWTDIRKMITLYLSGELTLEPSTIDGTLVSSVRSVPFSGHRGETVEHMTGKALVAAWLKSRGGAPQKEGRLFGGRVDVYCPTLKALAEVGDVAASRIFEMLTWRGADEVYLLPISEPLGDLAHELLPAEVPIIRLRLSDRGKQDLERLDLEECNRIKPPQISGRICQVSVVAMDRKGSMMKLTKAQRQRVWEKTSGVCYYCGCDLPERGWHADHVEAVLRDSAFVDGAFRPTGTMLRPQNHAVANCVPACSPCNLFKSAMSVEQFRREIEAQIERARQSSVNFRTAERFGLIEAKPQPVTFWFERQSNGL